MLPFEWGFVWNLQVHVLISVVILCFKVHKFQHFTLVCHGTPVHYGDKQVIVVAGVGCDAKVALEIHNLREENPDKFYNQVTTILLPNEF